MNRPKGYDEVVKVFGDIKPYIKHDGTLRQEWEGHTLARIDLPGEIKLGWSDKKVSAIRCHQLLTQQFKAAFGAIHAAGLWDQIHTFDGCFSYRPKRGAPGNLSLHSWGIAIDLNEATNKQGTTGDMHPGLIQCFEALGFLWGGRFSNPDPMHWQMAEGV
jgi:D-alanyl-D-alanine carboxypeptidase-like protein